MKILKQYNEFQLLKEANNMEELIAIRFELMSQELELEDEINNLEPIGKTTTHTDLQNRYPKYRVINDIGEASHKVFQLKNYLDFIKYGYE